MIVGLRLIEDFIQNEKNVRRHDKAVFVSETSVDTRWYLVPVIETEFSGESLKWKSDN